MKNSSRDRLKIWADLILLQVSIATLVAVIFSSRVSAELDRLYNAPSDFVSKSRQSKLADAGGEAPKDYPYAPVRSRVWNLVGFFENMRRNQYDPEVQEKQNVVISLSEAANKLYELSFGYPYDIKCNKYVKLIEQPNIRTFVTVRELMNEARHFNEVEQNDANLLPRLVSERGFDALSKLQTILQSLESERSRPNSAYAPNVKKDLLQCMSYYIYRHQRATSGLVDYVRDSREKLSEAEIDQSPSETTLRKFHGLMESIKQIEMSEQEQSNTKTGDWLGEFSKLYELAIESHFELPKLIQDFTTDPKRIERLNDCGSAIARATHLQSDLLAEESLGLSQSDLAQNPEYKRNLVELYNLDLESKELLPREVSLFISEPQRLEIIQDELKKDEHNNSNIVSPPTVDTEQQGAAITTNKEPVSVDKEVSTSEEHADELEKKIPDIKEPNIGGDEEFSEDEENGNLDEPEFELLRQESLKLKQGNLNLGELYESEPTPTSELNNSIEIPAPDVLSDPERLGSEYEAGDEKPPSESGSLEKPNHDLAGAPEVAERNEPASEPDLVAKDGNPESEKPELEKPGDIPERELEEPMRVEHDESEPEGQKLDSNVESGDGETSSKAYFAESNESTLDELREKAEPSESENGQPELTENNDSRQDQETKSDDEVQNHLADLHSLGADQPDTRAETSPEPELRVDHLNDEALESSQPELVLTEPERLSDNDVLNQKSVPEISEQPGPMNEPGHENKHEPAGEPGEDHRDHNENKLGDQEQLSADKQQQQPKATSTPPPSRSFKTQLSKLRRVSTCSRLSSDLYKGMRLFNPKLTIDQARDVAKKLRSFDVNGCLQNDAEVCGNSCKSNLYAYQSMSKKLLDWSTNTLQTMPASSMSDFEQRTLSETLGLLQPQIMPKLRRSPTY